MKNFILKTITLISVIAWLITAIALDNDAYFIQIMTINIISGVWIILFCFANKGELPSEC